MKMYGAVEVQLHSFHATAPGTHWLRGWIPTFLWREIFLLLREYDPISPVIHPVAYSLTDWTISVVVVFVYENVTVQKNSSSTILAVLCLDQVLTVDRRNARPTPRPDYIRYIHNYTCFRASDTTLQGYNVNILCLNRFLSRSLLICVSINGILWAPNLTKGHNLLQI
jgi:hypothetical protein